MNKKRVIALLLAASLAVVPTISVLAEETDQTEEEQEVISLEEANKTLEGYEDEKAEWEEVYIDSLEDLQAFARNCWLDTWSQDKKVYLTADINVAGSDFTSIPTFGGYFDGQGHTISGLSIKDGISYTGLFCYTQQSAVIANLDVVGAVKPSGKQLAVGGIVGDNSGIIMNCTFSGNIEGNDYVGGITGYNELTGIVIDCTNSGTVTGAHYTGGIVGENAGNIVGCDNWAEINTTNEDKGMSLEDINIQQYANNLFDFADNSDDDNNIQGSALNNTIDSGGIAGLSTGIIQYCTNKGSVGYEHVGYNVGGIVGRQSGYVYACENTAKIYGRKDVGGIVGQAEPYVAIDLSEDIAYQLTESINKLHDLIDKMLEDSGSESQTLSNRLSIIQSFADKALGNTSYLADNTVQWVDGMVGAANEMFSRADYIMDEAAKQNGVIDQTHNAAGNLRDAAESLVDVMDDLDIYSYMTEEEQIRYDNAKNTVSNATKEYNEYYADATKAYDDYYIDTVRNTDTKYQAATGATETDLKPYDKDGNQLSITWTLPMVDVVGTYKNVDSWKHYDDANGTTTDFLNRDDEEQYNLDADLQKDALQKVSDNSSDIQSAADRYAEDQYKANHGGNAYRTDVDDAIQTMYDITIKYTNQMSDSARSDAETAFDHAKDAAGNMETAGSETKRIFNDINGRADIVLPQLGSDYRSNTNDLVTNLKGISENMGYLNSEMLSTSDVMIDDLEAINDQFSSIMLLYTDAIDGVLDMDYTSVYEDNSEEDAETSTDATLELNTNNGSVNGDLNVSGIAGTMAIEYDFDLESDVTGIDDAKVNSTYLTKCILRENINNATVTAQKSDAGGIAGRQELGMILRCESYGKVKSNSGDYVGGIAGESLSHIKESYAKCALSGEEYVAGIVGSGSSIEDCYAMVRIQDATAFSGAIAGTIDNNGTVFGNYFVSDEIAGIDRISYSGKAEPISYEELMEVEKIPDEFRKMTIIFYADEEEITRTQCSYGGSISEKKYPEIPTKDGFYADWDKKELKNIQTDQDVNVEYVRYLTTLASGPIRDNGQSVILADGQFKVEDTLQIAQNPVEGETGLPEGTTEVWIISCPDDGNTTHQIRYQAPDGETEGVKIYVKDGEKWTQTDTDMMGIYYLFPMEGEEAQIAVVVTEKNMTLYIVLGVMAAVVLVVVIIWIVKKKKKTRAAQPIESKEPIQTDDTKQEANSAAETDVRE